ncbi:MAG TPA: right-handed parallel beta-helix repeat-containing protein, partial [Anaerolineaceae bacterium]
MKIKFAVNPSKLLAMVLIFGSCLAPGASGAAGQAVTIRYVSPGGGDSGNCAIPSQPCRTIQFAVDQAVSGDEVRLAGGEYTTQDAPIADIRVGLTLRGGYALTNWETADKIAHPTILKVSAPCEGVAAIVAGALERVSIQDLDIVGCGIGSTGDLLVERVSIQNGSIFHGAGANIPVALSEVTIQGGGFTHASGRNSLATLTHITISNSPGDGIRDVSAGGMALSDAQIVNCAGNGIVFANSAASSVTRARIVGNQVGIDTRSGGILTLDQVMVEDNRGRGVIDKSGGIVMKQVTIQGNHAVRDEANDDNGDGGGFYTSGLGSTLTDVVIRENTAEGDGGGIYDTSGGITLTRGTLAGNWAGGVGGGAWSVSRPVFIDSAVTANQAAAGGGV